MATKFVSRAIVFGLFWTATACVAFAVTQDEADAKFADQNWQEAVQAYEHLLGDAADNPGNWFNLATSYHQLEDYKNAEAAYNKALEHGFQRVPQVRLRMARLFMSTGEMEKSLLELEKIAESGGPSGRVVRGFAEFEPLQDNTRFKAVILALTPCTEAEYRHFDFWLGKWDVTPASASSPTAKSRISSREGGCVVLEEYETLRGYTGMSINFYDSAKQVWHQTWMANNGTPNYLEGRLNEDGAMVLTDAELPASQVTGTINRVTWTPDDDGGVRQFWETSSDNGETWSVGFDGYYTPRNSDD